MFKEIFHISFLSMLLGLLPLLIGKLGWIEVAIFPYICSPIILTKLAVRFFEKCIYLTITQIKLCVLLPWSLIQIYFFSYIREWIGQDVSNVLESFKHPESGSPLGFLVVLFFTLFYKSPLYLAAAIIWCFVWFGSVKLVVKADK